MHCESCVWFNQYEEDYPHLGDCNFTLPPWLIKNLSSEFEAQTVRIDDFCSFHEKVLGS